MMPLAYSISAGILIGMIAYVVINMICGKFKKLTPTMYILAILFIFNNQLFGFLVRILEKYTEYDGTITQTGAYTMLFLFIIFAIFSFVIPDEKAMDAETIGLRNFLLFSVAIQMFAIMIVRIIL